MSININDRVKVKRIYSRPGRPDVPQGSVFTVTKLERSERCASDVRVYGWNSETGCEFECCMSLVDRIEPVAVKAPPKQSVAELVEENASIHAQIAAMQKRITRKLEYVRANAAAITAQGGYGSPAF